MEIKFTNNIIKDLPVGYAYHKIICDGTDSPVNYKFVEINKNFEVFTGLKANDIIGKNITEVIPDIVNDSFDWIGFYGKIALEGGKSEFKQYSDTLKKWFRITVSSPEKYYFVTYFVDITQEILQLNEHITLLTALNEAVFEVNENYVFENVIIPEKDIFYHTKTEILYKSISELYPENIALLFIHAFKKAKVSLNKETIQYKSYLVNDDRWFSADIRYITISKSNKFIISIKDITQQKHRERELSEKTKELDRFFSVNLDLFCIGSKDGIILKVNKSWESILGYSTHYLEGKNVLEFVHPDDIKTTVNMLYKLLEDKKYANLVNRFVSIDGSYRYFEWNLEYYEEMIYAAARDITDRKLFEDELKYEQEKIKTTLMSIGDGVISVDENQKIVLFNKMAEHITGVSQDFAMGKSIDDVLIFENMLGKNPVINALKNSISFEKINGKLKNQRSNEIISIELSISQISSLNNIKQGVVVVFRDVTEIVKSRKEIEFISMHDYLTGLYNRRYFEEKLLKLDTESNLPLSVMILDVNGLKLTNDAFGHEMGDALLKKVSDVIKNACRDTDTIARTGGDEFAVVLPKTNKAQADIIKSRIADEAAKDTLESIVISIAIGYETKDNITQNIFDIINAAENFMYKDKLKTSKAMKSKTLNLIIDTLNSRYQQEKIHIECVSKICYHIGIAMQMSHDDAKILEAAGYLHDIGKIMAPNEIINKPGKLSEDEYKIITKHSEAGYQILKSVEEYSAIAEFVLCHHERWDGKGYPRHLKGEKIPLAARIISIADAFEAMTSDRPYRKAMSKEAALVEVQEKSGTQFDPEIVKIFSEKVFPCNFDEEKDISIS